MTMLNKLAGLGSRRGKAEAIQDVIQTPFQANQQSFAGNSLGLFSMFKRQMKLLLQQSVDALDLLFFTKLSSKSRKFSSPVPSMLARNGRPLFDRAFGETLLPFQEELFAFSPAQSANW